MKRYHYRPSVVVTFDAVFDSREEAEDFAADMEAVVWWGPHPDHDSEDLDADVDSHVEEIDLADDSDHAYDLAVDREIESGTW